MSSWSTKRKVTYLSIFFGVIFLVVIVPIFFAFYRQPTCFDGKKNGDEKDVDCGGSCQLLCSADSLAPNIIWSRAFKVKEGVYSAVAYIENRNISSEAVGSYTFKFYDKDNVQIGSRDGITFIPKNKVFAIFEPDIKMSEKEPYRVSFDFTNNLIWRKNLNQVPEISVTNKSLMGEETRPRVDATIENLSPSTVPRIEAVAIVYDSEENAIAASRTFVENLGRDQTAGVTFTWPAPFQTKEQICRISENGVIKEQHESLGVMIAIDRSSSMTSLGASGVNGVNGANPPQPLTDVKNAALSFVNILKGTGKIGLVSFATTASDPIDFPLSSDYQKLRSSIEKIGVIASQTQYTNLGDGIEKATNALLATSTTELTSRILILLTDGIATRPEKAGDNNYPSIYALEKADLAKKNNIELYIIGLGDEVNRTHLEGIATTPGHYFKAASSKDLNEIYKQIAVKICKVGPSVIEVIPRVIPANF